MESSGPDMSVLLDDQGRIAQDLPCIGCGYNLRSIEWEGQCPECGGQAARTTTFLAEYGVDRKSLRRIMWAMTALAVMMIFEFIMRQSIGLIVEFLSITVYYVVWLIDVLGHLMVPILLTPKAFEKHHDTAFWLRTTCIVSWAMSFFIAVTFMVSFVLYIYATMPDSLAAGLSLLLSLIQIMAVSSMYVLVAMSVGVLRRPRRRTWIIICIIALIGFFVMESGLGTIMMGRTVITGSWNDNPEILSIISRVLYWIRQGIGVPVWIGLVICAFHCKRALNVTRMQH